MKDFPVEMQGDIAMHLHREVLTLPIFNEASQGCLKAIAMQIKPMFCAPGEYVMHKGDAINCIYFVCNGSLEILKEGMVVAILGNVTSVTFRHYILFAACNVNSSNHADNSFLRKNPLNYASTSQ
jgi:hypothetical protein